MPFKSKKQATFLFAKKPKIAEKFEDEAEDFDDFSEKSNLSKPKGRIQEIIDSMSADESRETPEDEAAESPEHQELENELGVEKHRPSLFSGGKGIQILISVGKKK